MGVDGPRRARLVREWSSDIDRHCHTPADTKNVLVLLAEKLLATQPSVREDVVRQLTRFDLDTRCHCNDLLSALGALREDPAVNQKRDVLTALDQCVQKVLPSRNAARTKGIKISRKAWLRAERASQGETAEAQRGGRPSKVDDPHCVEVALRVAHENSQETSDVIIVNNKPVFKRVWTCTRYLIWLTTLELFMEFGWMTWCAILYKHAPEIRVGRRKTDYCDHCHLFRTKIVPDFWQCVSDCRATLVTFLPHMFDLFDSSHRFVKLCLDPEKYARAFKAYLNQYYERNRDSVNEAVTSVVLWLAEVAKAEDLMRWQMKLMHAFSWHRKSPAAPTVRAGVRQA